MDIQKLDEFEKKLANIKGYLQEVISLYERLERIQPTKLLFGVKRVEESKQDQPPVQTRPVQPSNSENITQQIKEMYVNGGFSTKQIAFVVKLDPQNVLKILEQEGIFKERRLTDEQMAQARQKGAKGGKLKKSPIAYKLSADDLEFVKGKYESGEMTPKTIAEKFGVASSTISYHIKKMGLTSPIAQRLTGGE